MPDEPAKRDCAEAAAGADDEAGAESECPSAAGFCAPATAEAEAEAREKEEEDRLKERPVSKSFE